MNILIGQCFSVFIVEGQIAVNQTNGMIFNRALLDEKIFPTLENKRRFVLKMIYFLDEEAKRKNLPFEVERWQNFCESIRTIQEVRNNLAHRFLSFSEGNVVHSHHLEKKLPKEREIKLDDELKKIERIYEESESAMTDFLNQALSVFSYN
ncbi:MAG: hypothetical protein AAB699_00850 [Patescibacteria group bacterium]